MSGMAKSTLVLGGARSGKSRFVQGLAENSGLAPVMIATAEAGDAEMAARIARHRAERDARWMTREVPFALVAALAEEARPGRIVVVDCVTLWLSNLMCAGQDAEAAGLELAAGLAQLAGPVVLVSNEVGFGLVPETELGRAFRDVQGRVNQALAAAAERAVLVVAGLPLVLKG